MFTVAPPIRAAHAWPKPDDRVSTFEVRDSFPSTSKVTRKPPVFSKIRMLLCKMCRNAGLQVALRMLYFHLLPYFSSTYSEKTISTFVFNNFLTRVEADIFSTFVFINF